MARFLKNKDASIGRAPGEIIFIGKQKVDESTIDLIDYDDKTLNERELGDITEGLSCMNSNTVTWMNINGLHDTPLIKSIGNGFGLHALVMDDIVNTGQRPKMKDHDDYIFFNLKMMDYDDEDGEVKSEQLSIILGKKFLLTFQECPGDIFQPVRDRIRKNKGRIRQSGTDYLAYTLLDTICDNYIYIIERLGERIEELEDEILDNPNKKVLTRINDYKREMNYLRKTVRPVKEFLILFSKIESDLIQKETVPFLKNLLDLTSQALEAIDAYRDMLSDHLNIYNTGINNRLNEIMKLLTIFSAIFIPLTFIAGIYGTNFDNVPELHFRYSYFIMWGVFLVITISMLSLFKRRRWL
ncbi:MAG: magnesium/cobalt transporter CorA [Spirochaetales bacterium]|uniref:Magnesium transport protein CorA n=1 Tax=Candidatus Thalassospirochaeta sargassi TaxID=3119039 RepID=A0AAJ1IHX2_9SPIO|nr:magnesium/cobalt transporter CorA [Spirochaetales bacterium]